MNTVSRNLVLGCSWIPASAGMTGKAHEPFPVTLNLFQGPVSSIADFIELDAETSSA
jgi:hypothetical protein